MPITLAITAAGPIHALEVVVKAEYLEGGGHSELSILLPHPGGTPQPLQVGLLCTRPMHIKLSLHLMQTLPAHELPLILLGTWIINTRDTRLYWLPAAVFYD